MSMFRARINSYLSEFINIELLIRKFEIERHRKTHRKNVNIRTKSFLA